MRKTIFLASLATTLFAVGSTGKVVLAGSETIGTRTMSFEQCISASENTIAQLNVSANRIVPVVNTEIVKITKIVTDDANIIITCSKADNNMVITKSTPPDLHLIR